MRPGRARVALGGGVIGVIPVGRDPRYGRQLLVRDVGENVEVAACNVVLPFGTVTHRLDRVERAPDSGALAFGTVRVRVDPYRIELPRNGFCVEQVAQRRVG